MGLFKKKAVREIVDGTGRPVVRSNKNRVIIFKGGLINERFLSTWSDHHTPSIKKG